MHGVRIKLRPFTDSKSITCDLITHNTSKYFHLLRKADWASFNIELKLKKQRTANVHNAEKTLLKAINAAAGRHIPQGRIKTMFANFSSEA